MKVLIQEITLCSRLPIPTTCIVLFELMPLLILKWQLLQLIIFMKIKSRHVGASRRGVEEDEADDGDVTHTPISQGFNCGKLPSNCRRLLPAEVPANFPKRPLDGVHIACKTDPQRDELKRYLWSLEIGDRGGLKRCSASNN